MGIRGVRDRGSGRVCDHVRRATKSQPLAAAPLEFLECRLHGLELQARLAQLAFGGEPLVFGEITAACSMRALVSVTGGAAAGPAGRAVGVAAGGVVAAQR